MNCSLPSLSSLFLAGIFASTLALGGCTSSSASRTPPGAQADTSRPEVPRAVTISTTPEEAPGGGLRLDTVEAQRFDQGKMWTFEEPPTEYFQEEYGFSPDEEWFERARLGALRIPGCTASFVSAHGLVLTNHHCGREYAVQVSRPGENLLETGFYAEGLDTERPVEGLYADQLIAIEDVTDEVEAALASAQTDAERAEARRAIFEDIEARLAQQHGAGGVHVEVVPLYHGARYSAYVYRRYEDLRLVMIPELALGYFGGDPDNFTYPRYALDMSFFRVYDEDGEPLEPRYYFPWDTAGSRPGEAVFVVGNPGSTLRLSTVAQLEFRRDVSDKALLRYIETRAAVLQAYLDRHPDSEEVQNRLFGLKNARKLYRGRLRGLNDSYILARRAAAQQAFVQALREDEALRARYGGVVDSLAALQQEKRAYAEAYGAFMRLQNYSSATFSRALPAHQLLQQRQQGASVEALTSLRAQLLGIPDQPDALNRRYLAARLEDLQYYFGADSNLVQTILQGRTPADAARAILQTSVLQDSASTARALESGALSVSDPAVELVDAFFSRYQDFQSAWAGLTARQQELSRRLGQARFAVYGTEVPPDATFTLRIADGRVKGYAYNGTWAAPYTSYFGLYDHYYSYGPNTPWGLPANWLTPPGTSGFDRAVSLNLVSTNDITGGNSGSPLLNKDLEVVGLIFDGNIQSLAGDFIYLPGRMRAISVDVRGMLEALDEMYDADRLVLELSEEAFVETETAAGD